MMWKRVGDAIVGRVMAEMIGLEYFGDREFVFLKS